MENSKEMALKKTMPWIFVCSPYRGTSSDPIKRNDEEEFNLHEAGVVAEVITAIHAMPIVPHLYFTQWLADEKEQDRRTGMQLGQEWLRMCDEVWVIGDRVSEGMKEELKLAKELGIPVYFLPDVGDLIFGLKAVNERIGFKRSLIEIAFHRFAFPEKYPDLLKLAEEVVFGKYERKEHKEQTAAV